MTLEPDQAQRGTTAPACLSDLAIAALADGTTGSAVRSQVIAHLAECAVCRARVAGVVQTMTTPAVVQHSPAGRWAARRRTLIPALAAAALLLFVARPLFDTDGTDGIHRAPTITDGSVPTALSPAGTVAAGVRFTWQTVTGADRYRLTLFAPDGQVLFETEPIDTAVTLPDSVRLAPGVQYVWRVAARTGFDRWVSSELIEFSIIRPMVR